MINKILAASTVGAPQPEVGMGATVLMWSDRHACTIIEVTHYKTGPLAGQVKTVTAQRDQAVRIDNNGMSDAQSYVFLPDPNGSIGTFTHKRKTGRYERAGWTLAIGYRDEFYDLSF